MLSKFKTEYLDSDKFSYNMQTPFKTFDKNLRLFIPLIFILNLILFLPVFFPTLNSIKPFDEAFYINGGRELTEGALPVFAHSPLVTFLFFLIYIPLQNLPYWIIHCCSVGRFVLFSLLWLSIYLVARQLRRFFHCLIMLLLILVSPALVNIITNGSDALFAAMSGFTLWQVLSYYNTKKINHLWVASIFMALTVLSRSEGLVLFFVFIPYCIILSFPLKRTGPALIAWITPFIIIIGGYISLCGLTTGSFELGIAKRAYDNFEYGQGSIIENLTPFQQTITGQIQSRQIYGTPEENNYSIVTAVRRNPKAYFNRVIQASKKIPKIVISVYGGWLGVVFFLLVARGIIELIKQRRYLLLFILLSWPGYLIVNFLVVFRENHFLSPYYIVFVLTSIGIASISSDTTSKKECFIWCGIFFISGIIGWVKSIPLNDFSLYILLIILIGLLSVWILVWKNNNIRVMSSISLFLFFCLALLIQVNILYKQMPISGIFRKPGEAPGEKAAVFLKEHLPPGSRVGTFQPRYVWVGKMTYIPMYLIQLSTGQELISWMTAQNLDAIYLDLSFRSAKPDLCLLIEEQIGKNLEIAFDSGEGDVQVIFPISGTDLKSSP